MAFRSTSTPTFRFPPIDAPDRPVVAPATRSDPVAGRAQVRRRRAAPIDGASTKGPATPA